MKHFRVQNCPGLSAKVGKKLLQGAALALILALALPARAADEPPAQTWHNTQSCC